MAGEVQKCSISLQLDKQTAPFYTTVTLKAFCNRKGGNISGCFICFRRESRPHKLVAVSREYVNMKEAKNRKVQEGITDSSWSLSPRTPLKQSHILKQHELWKSVPVSFSFK